MQAGDGKVVKGSKCVEAECADLEQQLADLQELSLSINEAAARIGHGKKVEPLDSASLSKLQAAIAARKALEPHVLSSFQGKGPGILWCHSLT